MIEEKELTEANETEAHPHKWVYLFEEGSGDNKSLFGGKGAGLCEMTQAGLPVPPGLIVTTEACNAFYANDKKFPEGMWEQVVEALHEVELCRDWLSRRAICDLLWMHTAALLHCSVRS